MTRIAEERTTVGQHTDEAAQQAQYGECIHLAGHTVVLVVETPTATKLNLTWARTVLEVTEHCSKHFISTRVEVIKDSLCQFSLNIQFVEDV